MKIIAFDVMGNDNGVEPAILASIEFIKSNLDYKIILIGDREEITVYLKELERIEILDTKNIANKDAGALFGRNEDNSLTIGMKLLKEEKVDVFLSSGPSAVLLTNATLILKRINGIKRPAFMPVFPTRIKDKKFIMLDVGANVKTTSEMLMQWANIGNIFSKIILGVDKPKVALLNIGVEDSKGNDFHKEANEYLKSSNIDYYGFIEPNKLLDGPVDVVVSDGYGGNLVLKTMEGTAITLFKAIKEEVTKNWYRKIIALFLKKILLDIKENFDYRNVGSAWIIGVNGLVVKAHGSADKKSYLGAFSQISIALENNMLEKIKEEL